MIESEAGLGWIGQVGGWAGMVALTALLFWLLASGRLLTRSQHDSIVTLHEARVKEVQKTLDTALAQNTALIESSTAAREFFEKVPIKRMDEEDEP